MRNYNASLLCLCVVGLLNTVSGQSLPNWSDQSNDKRLIEWTRENRARQMPYFGSLNNFSKIYYRRLGDTVATYGWVYHGPRTPRLIDSQYLKSLCYQPYTARITNGFYCDYNWRYQWVEVRMKLDRWTGFTTMGMGREYTPNTLGGFLLGTTPHGLLLARPDNQQLAYIPYRFVRNVRKGQSMWAFFNNSSSYNSDVDFIYALMFPFVVVFHNFSGMFPQKVHRSRGDSTGLDFQRWVKESNSFGQSENEFSEFPKVIRQQKQRIVSVDSRYGDPQFVDDFTEHVADQIISGEIPRFVEVIQTDANANKIIERKSVLTDIFERDRNRQADVPNAMGIPTLELGGDKKDTMTSDSGSTVSATTTTTAIQPSNIPQSTRIVQSTSSPQPTSIPQSSNIPQSNGAPQPIKPAEAKVAPTSTAPTLPTAKPAQPTAVQSNIAKAPEAPAALFDQRRNMGIQWAYQGFSAAEVDAKLMKRFGNIRSNRLSESQLSSLSNRNDVQFLAMYLITSNGLLLNKLVKFTPDQIITLEKVTPIYAEEANPADTLNAGDMSETDVANLEVLYNKLQKVK
jgi:hypothetical protein